MIIHPFSFSSPLFARSRLPVFPPLRLLRSSTFDFERFTAPPCRLTFTSPLFPPLLPFSRDLVAPFALFAVSATFRSSTSDPIQSAIASPSTNTASLANATAPSDSAASADAAPSANAAPLAYATPSKVAKGKVARGKANQNKTTELKRKQYKKMKKMEPGDALTARNICAIEWCKSP
ncbi:hypothetical protein BC827DRAFT_1175066 [Russula dissimulans]|nr:hypothetical protein BC827DRAFT_1175066 [Russula dissimulans]